MVNLFGLDIDVPHACLWFNSQSSPGGCGDVVVLTAAGYMVPLSPPNEPPVAVMYMHG